MSMASLGNTRILLSEHNRGMAGQNYLRNVKNETRKVGTWHLATQLVMHINALTAHRKTSFLPVSYESPFSDEARPSRHSISSIEQSCIEPSVSESPMQEVRMQSLPITKYNTELEKICEYYCRGSSDSVEGLGGWRIMVVTSSAQQLELTIP